MTSSKTKGNADADPPGARAPGPLPPAPPRRRFEPDDLLLEERPKAIAARPGRGTATVAVQTIDAEADVYRSTLWHVGTDDEALQPLSAGTAIDDDPKWSPDGRTLAFLSDRDGGAPQLFTMPGDGGEARLLRRFEQGVVSFDWRGDSGALLVVAPVAVDPAQRGARTRGRHAGGTGGPQVAWRLPYKMDGLGYTLDQELHLFTVAADGQACQRLTHGAFDVRGACWAPDGRRIAFCRTREGAEAHCTDIWDCAADGSDARRLTTEQATAQTPCWSPDGRWIAFAGNHDAGDAQARPWLIDRRDDEPRVRPLGDEDLEVLGTSLAWDDDAPRLWLIRAHRGRQSLVQLSVPDGEVHEVAGGDRQVSQFAVAGERVVFSVEDGRGAPTLWSRSLGADDERRLDRFNRWHDERCRLRVEARRFEVPDGDGGQESVEGWVIRSEDAEGPQPLLVDVHGGPASYVFLAASSHPYWSILCSRGWTVLALNAVGSSSFGRDFAGRLRARWGEADLPQHEAAARALQREQVADAQRVAIAGKSYGGYLAAWAIGHTGLFRAAVVTAPVTNLETHYGTSDSGFYADPYSMLGKPFTDRETSRRLSPMKQADRAVTPTLLLQGADDERCPKCQSEELYVTLARGAGAACELVVYPGGSHHLFEDGRPSHRVDAQTRLVEWLEQFIDQPLAERPPPRGE